MHLTVANNTAKLSAFSQVGNELLSWLIRDGGLKCMLSLCLEAVRLDRFR